MKKIFGLTKWEQRVVILIVVALITIAFAKHWIETNSASPSIKSTSSPTASPTIHPQEAEGEADGSR